MTSLLVFLFSQTILIPLTTGLVRLKRIGQVYRPFFILMVLGVVEEAVSSYLIKVKHHSNAIPNNLFALAESLLILWQFHEWGLWRANKRIFYGLITLFCLVWLVEDVVLEHIHEFPPYFMFLYSFLSVLLSVNKINFMITHDNRKLLQRPDFLICIGLIIYFVYKILYEWAYQVSLLGETYITINIVKLFSYINALTNIIFAIAFLLMPAPQKFKLREGMSER